MCKIFAAAGDIPFEQKFTFHEFMSDLFAASIFDGKDKDAAGFYAWSGDRTANSRESGPADEFPTKNVAWKRLEQNPAKLYLCHARGAMGPTLPLRNNHPFVGDNVALAHEGWITGHTKIAQSRGLTLATDTDSELFMRVADQRRLPLGSREPWTPSSCMKGMLAMTTEPTAIAMIDHSSRSPKLTFGRNANGGNHLFAFYYVPRFRANVLVSTTEMMDIACGVNNIDDYELLYNPKPMRSYEMSWDGSIEEINTQAR